MNRWIIQISYIFINGFNVDGHTNLDNVSIAGVSTFTGLIDIKWTQLIYLELFHYGGTNFSH